jgi:hypothetical protein
MSGLNHTIYASKIGRLNLKTKDIFLLKKLFINLINSLSCADRVKVH